jgi:hypothetical protein
VVTLQIRTKNGNIYFEVCPISKQVFARHVPEPAFDPTHYDASDDEDHDRKAAHKCFEWAPSEKRTRTPIPGMTLERPVACPSGRVHASFNDRG